MRDTKQDKHENARHNAPVSRTHTAVTILGSENCRSISVQNLLSASEASQGLWLYTVNRGSKATAVILPDYWPDKKNTVLQS